MGLRVSVPVCNAEEETQAFIAWIVLVVVVLAISWTHALAGFGGGILCIISRACLLQQKSVSGNQCIQFALFFSTLSIFIAAIPPGVWFMNKDEMSFPFIPIGIGLVLLGIHVAVSVYFLRRRRADPEASASQGPTGVKVAVTMGKGTPEIVTVYNGQRTRANE